DLDATDQFHDKVGPSAVRRPAVENFGDVRMVHEREGLAFGFETRDDGPRVHAKADDLERDATPNRFLLFGHVNDTAAALANLLKKLVTADFVAGLFDDGNEPGADRPDGRRGFGEERAGLFVAGEQRRYRLTQGVVVSAGLGQKSLALSSRRAFQGGGENLQLALNGRFHWSVVRFHTLTNAKWEDKCHQTR